MRQLLNSEDISCVAGGNIYINANTRKFTFDTIDEVFKFKPEVDLLEAQALCNSKIGKYATIEEFDAECLKALRAEGWVLE